MLLNYIFYLIILSVMNILLYAERFSPGLFYDALQLYRLYRVKCVISNIKWEGCVRRSNVKILSYHLLCD
jgi:hypothetical protein